MVSNVFRGVLQTANSGRKGFVIVILATCAASLLLSALLALPWGGLASASCRWDCFWYSDIATNGYSRLPLLYDGKRPAQASWAFFPLYPLLTSTLRHFLALSTQSAGLLVNIALWPFLIFLCNRDLELRDIRTDRVFFVLFFVLYPFNVWYTAQYSEAVYGATLMAAIVALRSGWIGLAALTCALMAIARPTGFIMTVCLSAWWLFSRPRDAAIFTRETVRHRLSDSLLLIAAGGAGLSLFVLYLFHLTGDGFAFAHVEIAWHKRFRFFLLHIFHALGHKHQIQFGVFALLAVAIIWRMCSRAWALNAFLVGSTALLASSAGAESIERYVFGNPLTIQFLACSTLSRSQRFAQISLAIMACLHIVTTILWYRESRWVM
ncbi:hypothetical protein [Acetobacter fallax]|uniref:Mannosyltransferase (PIG-V) n=1 Tax=Acetobacter fallax TaxID=1737473 RepID=A0ABX0KCK9_9PROT|nr:hypothetical protein [Acetobacter fallax]NHO33533.1 hypothetical protein [Acetobacter fallax]NHO37124.1 hypothetical protein [Acetobacter fallax]